MIIKSVPIESINPAPYNPRIDLKEKDPEYQKLKRSIETFDLVEPLIWNQHTGNLIGGHQRLKILKDRGDKTVEVSVVDIKDQRKEKALNVALNKVQGDWDIPKLKELLVELDDGEFDVTLTGFEELELKDMVDYTGKAGLTEDDAVPETPKEAITKPGNIWELGKHRLFCSDCLSIKDNGFKLIVTDPPYNVGFGENNLNLKAKEWDPIQNDSRSDDEHYEWLMQRWKHLLTLSEQPTVFYVWSPPMAQGYTILESMVDSGIHVQSQIVWVKNVFNLGQADYQWQHELCWYGYAGKHHTWNGNRDKSTTWLVDRDPQIGYQHPTQKPVELFIKAIMNSSNEGEKILDPFMGSGSSLIAAERLNRVSYGVEIEPRYCDVIIERWQNFTGQKAKLLNKG